MPTRAEWEELKAPFFPPWLHVLDDLMAFVGEL
jgi:hypothetical protein